MSKRLIISKKQALKNANQIKNDLIKEIVNKGSKADTQEIVSRVSEHPCELIALMLHCKVIDKEYGTNTMVEVKTEVDFRFE